MSALGQPACAHMQQIQKGPLVASACQRPKFMEEVRSSRRRYAQRFRTMSASAIA
jgi:hypothetical protein